LDVLFALCHQFVDGLVFALCIVKVLNAAVNQTHAVLQKAFDNEIKDGIRKNPGNERD